MLLNNATQAIKGAETEGYEAALALYEDDLLIEDIYEDWTARRREQFFKALDASLILAPGFITLSNL